MLKRIPGNALEFVVDSTNRPQNLFATMVHDSGSVTASGLTDTFTIAGGTDIVTSHYRRNTYN